LRWAPCKRSFENARKLDEFFPFLLKEMDGDIVEFNVIGRFAVGFFGFPNHIILGLSQSLGAEVFIIIGHAILLERINREKDSAALNLVWRRAP
jgi:hypothetical protein